MGEAVGFGAFIWRHVWSSVATVSLIIATLSALGCDVEQPIGVRFDRFNRDPAAHVFPSDEYLGDVVIDGFSELQLAAQPYLAQLRYTAQIGWSPTTTVRIPITAPGEDASRWLDAASLDASVRIYDVTSAQATLVALGARGFSDRTNSIFIRPAAPFRPGTYGVVVEAGALKTRAGDVVETSADYAVIQRDGDPETDLGFGRVVAADGRVNGRNDTLAYFQFTVGDHLGQGALLAAYIAGQAPVNSTLGGTTDVVLGLTPWLPEADRQISMAGAKVVAQGDAQVAALYAASGLGALDTRAIDKVVGGAIASPTFISDTVFDPLNLFFNGTFLGREPLVPFHPANPLSLATTSPSKALPYLAVYPKVSPPQQPLPMVVAIHDMSRSKGDWLALANTVCATGHGLIAIDLYQHGDRQEDVVPPEGAWNTKVDPVLAAVGVNFPDPFYNPTFLARSRDRIRQSVVDNLALIRLLGAGDGANPIIDFDGDGVPDALGPIRLIGQGVGASVATIVGAVSPNVDRVLLSAPGGPWQPVLAISPAYKATYDTLIYATANAPQFGLLAGAATTMIFDGPERELYNVVADVVGATADPAAYGPALLGGVLTGGKGGPRVLVQLALKDVVMPLAAGAELSAGVAAGADPAAPFQQLPPVLIPLGYPVWEAPAPGALPAASVSQFAAGHGFLLDFSDVNATIAAQTQAAAFLLQP